MAGSKAEGAWKLEHLEIQNGKLSTAEDSWAVEGRKGGFRAHDNGMSDRAGWCHIGREEVLIHCRRETLEKTQEYPYLGVELTRNGKMN